MNYSDAWFTDASNIPAVLPDQTSMSLVKLYAASGNAGPQCDFDPDDDGSQKVSVCHA